MKQVRLLSLAGALIASHSARAEELRATDLSRAALVAPFGPYSITMRL
ncbi:MAG TPA: hypothetical protein VGI70_09435 [Polyangiales bacterium]|jgi:hypothetical protein